MSEHREGSIDYVAGRLLRFVRANATGFARSSFRSEFARQAVLSRLDAQGLKCQDRLLLAGPNADEAAIPRAVDAWIEEVESHHPPAQIISLVLTASPGAEHAFERLCGRLNLYRERIAAWQAAFVLWLPEIWLQPFANAIPDFDSWIMLRLELTEEINEGPKLNANERSTSASTLHPDEARRIAQRRIERSQSATGADALGLAAAAVDTLLRASLPAEARAVALEQLPRFTSIDSKDITSLRDRAKLFVSANNYASAEQDLRAALGLATSAATPDELEIAELAVELGNTLVEQAKYSEAEPLYNRSLEYFERVLGPEHASTLNLRNLVATSLYRRGLYSQAEPILVRLLADRERVFGYEHPQTILSLHNLAGLYFAEGRHDEAAQLCKRELALSERALGPDHPYTLKALDNLAVLYRELKRYAEAEALYQRAIAASERVLGPEHPDTLTALQNLALLYMYMQDRFPEAKQLLTRVLAARERVLGADHPDTLSSTNNLAILYDTLGEYGKAEALFAHALAARERIAGPQDTDTLTLLTNLARFYDKRGRYSEAESLYARALAASERIWGSDHPTTSSLRAALAALREKPQSSNI